MSRKPLLPLLVPSALLALMLFSPTVHAQARVAVYGSVGAEKSGQPNQGWAKAGVIGLYADAANLGPLAVAVDVRGDCATDNKSFIVGPRLALHFPAFPLKPYSEILVGRTSYTQPSNPNIHLDSRFTASYVGGIDTTIFPHLDWRIFDFTYALDNGLANRRKNLTTGLVVRF